MGRVEQIDRRRDRGRSESYEITNLGESAVLSRFGVTGPSGRAYEVCLRDLKTPVVHCSCLDFATNGLGTCKHTEALLAHLEEQQPEALAAARQTSPTGALVYLDSSINPPQLRFVARGDDDAAAKVDDIFDGEGQQTEAGRGAAFEAFAETASEQGIGITKEARRFGEQQQREGERLADNAAAAKEFGAFRAAVIAKRDEDQEPDPDNEALVRFVKHFGDLAHWQLDGAAHLVAQGRALLADDPELDKVDQSLAAAEFLRATGRVTRILVTCPASRRQLWTMRILNRCAVDPRIVGGSTFEELARAEANASYAVSSYNRLYRHLDKLQAVGWDVLILDEVQRIKSWPAPTGRALKTFDTRSAFALTSARLEFRPQAFFYTVQLLDPNLLGPAWQFMDDHVVRDARGAAVGDKDLDKALARAGDCWLRRGPEDTAGPGPEMDLFVEVTNSQHRLLDPLLRTLLAMARVKQAWSEKERGEVVEILGRIRALVTLPELVKPERPGSPKLDELAHLIEDICLNRARRVLVFSRQDHVAQAIAERLGPTGVPIHHWPGESTAAERTERLAALAADKDAAVLVIADDVAAGLDLAPVADIAIHAELPWSPTALATRRQTFGRTADNAAGLFEINLLCAGTPESASLEAHRHRADHLAKLITTPNAEPTALAEAEEWQLRELIGVLVDERMVLRPKKALLAGKAVGAPAKAFTLRGLKAKERNRKSQSPQQRYLLGEKRDNAAAGHRPDGRGTRPGQSARGSRPAQAGRGSRPRGAGRSTRPSKSGRGSRPGPGAQAAPDILVLGLETREDRAACEEASKVHTLGLAMAVTYSFRTGTFTAWRSEYINDLVRTLMNARLVVGHNPFGFEYKILGPYTGRNLSRISTVDLLLEITKKLGRKVPFDLITAPTLDKAWTSDRSRASAFFKEGKVREVAGLCTEGVKIVRDLFVTALSDEDIMAQAGPDEAAQAIRLDLRSRVDPQLHRLIRSR